MKFGARKPNLKKSIKARTTGRAKRVIKKSINPSYCKKGMGWVNNPKKAAYNKVYNKTSFNIFKNPLSAIGNILSLGVGLFSSIFGLFLVYLFFDFIFFLFK